MLTIDGPAASGKTSVSREVANRLGWKWVSTGAFYRGLGFMALKSKTDLNDESALVKLIESDEWSVLLSEEKTHFLYKGQDVSDEIFLEEVGNIASQVSHYPKVRKSLLQAQRDLASQSHSLVAEGRDCGSVVFPNADVKIYLTARSESRAQRRAEEQGSNLEQTIELQKKRDEQDSQRKAAPLQVPEGAHVIDTSELNLEQVVERVTQIVKSKLD